MFLCLYQFASEYLTGSLGGKMPWFVEFANFYGINTLAMANFELPSRRN